MEAEMKPSAVAALASPILLAFVRNCGVAIAISIFFAAAHHSSSPSHPGEASRMTTAVAHIARQ
jgi:hypothetical protein